MRTLLAVLSVFLATIGSAVEDQIDKLKEWVESKAIR